MIAIMDAWLTNEYIIHSRGTSQGILGENVISNTMRKNYTSLSEATADLTKRGYTETFILRPECLEYNSLQLKFHPEDFVIDEFYRFEGMSSADDNSIVFAVSSKNGLKGIVVDAYGVYSESLNDAMIQKLSIAR